MGCTCDCNAKSCCGCCYDATATNTTASEQLKRKQWYSNKLSLCWGIHDIWLSMFFWRVWSFTLFTPQLWSWLIFSPKCWLYWSASSHFEARRLSENLGFRFLAKYWCPLNYVAPEKRRIADVRLRLRRRNFVSPFRKYGLHENSFVSRCWYAIDRRNVYYLYFSLPMI